MFTYCMFRYMKDRLSRYLNRLYILALTEQVGPLLCAWRRKQIQLSERCVVWGKETMNKRQLPVI